MEPVVVPLRLGAALKRTVEWERAHLPAGWDPRQFDYGAEDSIALGEAEA